MQQGSYSEHKDIMHRCKNFRSHGDVALGICARRLVGFDDQECTKASRMWHV